MDFSSYVFSAPYFGWLCNGVLMTLSISMVSGIAAAGIGFFVLRCCMSPYHPIQAVGAAFVIVFRNLPLMPLLLFMTFAIPGLFRGLFGIPLAQGFEFPVFIIGLALNTAAYFAEILRAGVAAVVPEQTFAARTLGLSPRTIRNHVIFPQAVRVVAPALATRFIHNMKNSTLGLVVPLPMHLMEVVGQAGRIAGETFAWAEPLVFAACVHLSLALGLGWTLNHWASREQARIEAAP
jgi:His/Glu/Gln/Arg/opine family amino acid ABC transporter permease subunit